MNRDNDGTRTRGKDDRTPSDSATAAEQHRTGLDRTGRKVGDSQASPLCFVFPVIFVSLLANQKTSKRRNLVYLHISGSRQLRLRHLYNVLRLSL